MNALPPNLASKLADFRRRVWWVKLMEGVLAGLVGLLVSYLLVLLMDRAMETPGWLRGLLLVGGASVVVVGLPLKWHRWVWRQRGLEDAARLLRVTFPRLGDQLLGIVELAGMEGGAAGRSERLVQAAMEQADEEVKGRDFRDAVPEARHRQWAWVAGALGLMGVLGFVLVPDAAWNALERWAQPWAQVERFTFVRVVEVPDRLVVPFAEPVDWVVRLEEGSRWQPQEAVVRLPGGGRVVAERKVGEYCLRLPPQSGQGEMRLSVGDVRRTVELLPQPRPEMTRLALRLKLPGYLGYATEPEVEVRGGSVSVLEGTRVQLLMEAARAVAAVEMDGFPATVVDGALVAGWEVVTGEAVRELTWVDELGLTPKEPLRLRVKAVADAAPRVVARKEALEQVVLDTEVVSFEVTASDDFGVKEVGLEWKGVPVAGARTQAVAAEGGKVTQAGGAEVKQVTGPATFCAVREGIEPQTVEVRAWVTDSLPGRERAYSAAFVLHVLNATDHSMWLTQQMGKWLEVARETYEREQQLHMMNQELRAMTAAELDQPQNRRKVAQQATAEEANAARLEALQQAGRRLAGQATKNPEFDAKRLESWAQMLRSLGAIAAERMPSVADLLKQSANAAVGEPSAAGDANPADPSALADQEPKQGDGGSKSAGEAGPELAAGPGAEALPKKAGGASGSDEGERKPVAPRVKLTDVATTKAAAKKEGGEGSSKSPPSGGGNLSLPTNQVGAAPGKGEDKPQQAGGSAQTLAQEKLEESIWEQRDLLAEFAAVTDQLSEILGSLEASTFVKRFKAASKEQMTLAGQLQKKTLASFGLNPPPQVAVEENEKNEEEQEGGGAGRAAASESPEKRAALPKWDEEGDLVVALEEASMEDARKILANRSLEESEVVRIIQGDLNAYTQRRPDTSLKRVLGQMKETQVTRELKRVGAKTAAWLSGHAIVGAEYWADVLDRWAEEIVPVVEGFACEASGSSDSLPPEIVLKVMQALQDEMKLRDETRELENAKPALEEAEHGRRALRLSSEQSRIAVKTQSAFQDILALPGGGDTFGRELQLLAAVRRVMDEVVGQLDLPETGDPAVAAETEAIELLLQTKRQNPNGGGGGGGGSPGGGGGGGAGGVALGDLDGVGADNEAGVTEERSVGQSTGRAGREFPPEFKSGLDAYFNHLEANPAAAE